MPAQGVLQYHIARINDISTREKVVVIFITDGFIAKRAEVTVAIDVNVRAQMTDTRLNQLWLVAPQVPMKAYRQAGNREAASLFDDATDAMYAAVEAVAEPAMVDVLAAAVSVLSGSRKQLEWDKLTAMITAADEADRHKFMALVALIAISRG